jgi:glutamate 5-kinase
MKRETRVARSVMTIQENVNASAAEGSLRYRRIVAKFGTNLLTAGTDRLDLEVMAALVGQVARLVRRGAQVIVVSSGAVTAGRHRLGGVRSRRRELSFRHVLAAIGQSHLMNAYDELFGWHDLVVGQMLLTRRDLIADRLSYINARNALLGLLEVGAVPIVNENDVVANDEVIAARIGDNDNLSAYVANVADADLLAILTNIGGLYTADPHVDPAATLIPLVPQIDAEVERLAGRVIHQRSRGGMATKLQAARLATGSGVDVVIADGHEPNVLYRLATGEGIGTRFPATAVRMESYKRWLRAGDVRGTILVDAGAARAVAELRRSLLPAGVTGVEGSFEPGDLVRIVGPDGRVLANGLTRYASRDVDRIRGKSSGLIPELLGYSFGDEVIHRDYMVVD